MKSPFRLSAFAAAILFGAVVSFRMSEDAPAVDASAAAPTAPVEPVAPADVKTVAVEVPAEHADLLQRAVELLKRGEQFVKDNIEAGVTMLENLFKSDEENQ